ncbi:MAG: hypothetical protein OEN23_19355 [Paracoccaceae bacterium]|nr:hypothetical protein [Paracoccaceae bacterium]
MIRAALIGLLAAFAACGGPDEAPVANAEGRVITLALWAGSAEALDGPRVSAHPVTGLSIDAYRRRAEGREQVLTVTQGGAALGRVLDRQPGMPERRFTGDAIFPLGLWRQGESRQFQAQEVTLLGPAERRVTIEILDLGFEYEGVPRSLRFRVIIRDAAGRPIACETSIYSPGRGLVAFEASALWRGGAAC